VAEDFPDRTQIRIIIVRGDLFRPSRLVHYGPVDALVQPPVAWTRISARRLRSAVECPALLHVRIMAGLRLARMRPCGGSGASAGSRWTTRKGVFRPGIPFRWPALRLLLTNVLYIGGVRHKHEIVPGQQDAIIGKALFEEVNAILSRRDFGGTTAIDEPALLSGLLYCEACGSAIVPTYIKRKRSAVRSYACPRQAAEAGLGCAIPPVSAALIETKVLERVRSADGTEKASELATP
jgi:Recombinase zinc beta ribbon domain